jgi:hypothetical protein
MTEVDGELMEELISAESKCNVTSVLSVVNKYFCSRKRLLLFSAENAVFVDNLNSSIP